MQISQIWLKPATRRHLGNVAATRHRNVRPRHRPPRSFQHRPHGARMSRAARHRSGRRPRSAFERAHRRQRSRYGDFDRQHGQAGPRGSGRRSRATATRLHLLVLIFLVELLARDLLIGHVRQLQQDSPRPSPRRSARGAARAPAGSCDSSPRPPAPARETGAHCSTTARLDLLVGHLDVVLLADLGKHQPEPHAAFGKLAVFGLRLLLGGALVREGAALRA